MAPSTRLTVSVRLRERQLVETIAALQSRDRAEIDTAGVASLTSALLAFERALSLLRERLSS